jgi:hypothetical protein
LGQRLGQRSPVVVYAWLVATRAVFFEQGFAIGSGGGLPESYTHAANEKGDDAEHADIIAKL